MLQIFDTFDYDIDKTGLVPVTEKLQKLIDKAGEGKGKVIISEGIYLTGSLFMKSGIEFHLKEGAVLLGSQEEAEYPLMQTRAAGVEMNADGMSVNRICENVEVKNCIFRQGMGLAPGSDMAGGMRNIHLHDISFYGTDNGFYIKSAKTQGGIIEDIIVENLDMINVDYAINLNINWFPNSFGKISVATYSLLKNATHLYGA